MKKLTALLIALPMLLCAVSCSDTGTPDSDTGSAGAVPVHSSGYDDSDSAYKAFYEACMADDSDSFYLLFSETEINACLALTQEKTGLSDTDFKQLSMCFEEKRFKKNIDGLMNDIQLSMKNFGNKDDTWTVLPGTSTPAGEAEISGFKDMLGIGAEDMTSYEYFFFEDKSADASCAGSPCTTVKIDGKWYPSYYYTAGGLVNVYQN